MVVRSNRSRGGRVAPRRTFVWARNSQLPTAIGSPLGTNLLGEFEVDYGANLLGATCVRIRGIVLYRPSVAAADQRAVLGVRMGTSGPAFEANGPVSAPTADWMVYEPFLWSDNGVPGALGILQERVIDVKSSRKIGELHQELRLFVESEPAGVGSIAWDLSIGMKLA